MDSCGSGNGSVAVSYKRGSETLGSTKDKEFFDQLIDYQHHKDYAPCIKLVYLFNLLQMLTCQVRVTSSTL
jgi:hypothetical protein